MNDKEIFEKLFKPQMAEFLSLKKFSDYEMTEIIVGAPVSLNEKSEILQSYYECTNSELAKYYLEIIENGIDELTLTDCDVFVLEEKTARCEATNFTLYRSYKKALSDAKSEQKGHDGVWHNLKKYRLNQDGDYRLFCDFEIIDGKICFFARYGEYEYIEDIKILANSQLMLPLPFKVGDIISFHASPYTTKEQALIIEKGNGLEYCFVLFIYDDGSLYVGPLSLNAIFDDIFVPEYYAYDTYSLLYRLEKFEGASLDRKRLLGDIAHLCNDESTGKKLYQFLAIDNVHKNITAKEVLSFLRRLKNQSKE